MKTTFTFILSGALLFVSCREWRNEVLQPSVPSGAFQFTSYDGSGNIVDTGWLIINTEDPNNVSGLWELSTQERGELRGSIANGKVVIDLHPDMADNNFILSGNLQGTTYMGEWEKIGIAGVMASGTFFAQQR